MIYILLLFLFLLFKIYAGLTRKYNFGEKQNIRYTNTSKYYTYKQFCHLSLIKQINVIECNIFTSY